MVRRSVLDRIFQEMQNIRYRLDELEKTFSKWKPPPLEISESDLFLLPDHLRKTYLIVASKGESNATEVSNLTGRCRANESSYLNQLVRMGWLTKRRDSKTTDFRVVSGKVLKTTIVAKGKAQTLKAEPQKMRVKCLSSDYDGTISPLNVSRNESRVPLETSVMLRQISRHIPTSVITMKDLSFVIPRTPFANAWSAIGGLETRIGNRVLKRESLEHKLSNISRAVEYARSHITSIGVEIEEKQDSEGRTIAFCVDWRRARDLQAAKREAVRIAAHCKALKLGVITYGMQPFYDVYSVAPDKGRALQEMLDELSVKNGVLYLGDSEADNSAFRASGVSVGVVHDETPVETLDCDYLVKFEDVPEFLNALLANDLVFSSDFPMIKTNPRRTRRQ